MRKNYLFLLFLLSAVSLDCEAVSMNSSDGRKSDLNEDFPTAEKLRFKSAGKYKIAEETGGSVIDGNVLWHFEYGEDQKVENFGCCYDLETGKELSVIAMRGDAADELTGLEWYGMSGDSVTLWQDRKTMKTFAKKDIVSGMPMEDRKCSVWRAPNDLLVAQAVKLPDGTVLATVRPAVFEFEKAFPNALNQKSIVLFGENGVKGYDVIDYDSFDLGDAAETEFPANDLVKWNYAQGCIGVKDNHTVAFSVDGQFILYTWDVNTGKVLAEKRYTDAERDGGEMSFTTTNECRLSILDMAVSEQYIVCDVIGYFSEEDKEAGKMGRALFVFDWSLKPVKRFDLATRGGGYYRVATDCSAVYFCKQSGEHTLSLYKADLNI